MGGDSHLHYGPEAQPKKDQDLAVLKANKIPLGFRDHCAHLLVDLNKCRRDTFFSPWSCGHERHTYEQCEHILYERRVEMKKKKLAQEKAAAAV